MPFAVEWNLIWLVLAVSLGFEVFLILQSSLQIAIKSFEKASTLAPNDKLFRLWLANARIKNNSGTIDDQQFLRDYPRVGPLTENRKLELKQLLGVNAVF